MERDWWVDERQDPEKSTRAAAHHLKDLYNEFGDWYLAMAAYNSGPGTVQNAVKRTGYADFWQLYKRNVLPKETRNYVPIILAVTIMAKNPGAVRAGRGGADQPVPYDTVKIDYPVDLRLVAECVDASASTLQDLNPSLSASDHAQGSRFRTPSAGRHEGSLSQRDYRHSAGYAGVVALSQSRSGRYFGLGRARLSHQPSGDCAGQ